MLSSNRRRSNVDLQLGKTDNAIEHPLATHDDREILFRILQGPQGWMLRQIANKSSRLSHMRDTIGGYASATLKE